MLDQIEKIFDDRDTMLRELTKESYKMYMDGFFEKNAHYFYEMIEYTGKAVDKKAAADEIATCLTEKVGTTFARRRKKIPSYLQADLNMFMVYYFFPSLLKTGKDDAKLIAAAVCDNWNHSFRNSNISYTDYDTIYNAFRRKFLGFEVGDRKNNY